MLTPIKNENRENFENSKKMIAAILNEIFLCDLNCLEISIKN